ncbi:hypothetical protein ACHAXA_009358 [Cyclostephanos tholiformis]|uniref:Uncharacterized protein n=1 Tax=Cyclostephanos tholiformis TaxID=382380 RepID=A0ABD3SQ72_9STRA
MVRFSITTLAGGVLTSNISVVDSVSSMRRTIQHGEAVAASMIIENGPSPRHPERRLEFDGSYNLQFSHCVDVKIKNDDLFGDDVLEYTKAGQIVSARSYVLFRICRDGNCGGGGSGSGGGQEEDDDDNDDDLYLLDLSTYVRNVASYHASARGAYCNACDDYYYDFCENAGADDDDIPSNDDAAAVYYNDGGDDNARRLLAERIARRRSSSRRTATSYISCSQCEAYGCRGDDGDYNAAAAANTDEAVIEIINDVSDCLKTGINWNGNELYVGFMCSSDGDGVELAVYLDDQCIMYTNQKSFADIPSYYIYSSEDIFTMAETHIKSAFTETTSCTDEEFGDPNNEGDESDDAVSKEVNGYCASIFQSDLVAFNSCDEDPGNDDENNSNQNAMDDIFSFYDYDMDHDDNGDVNEVCTVLKRMGGTYSYYYDSEKSGSWNNNGSGKSSSGSSVGSWYFLKGDEDGLSLIAICLYVFLGIAAIVLVLFAIGDNVRRRRARMAAPIYEGSSFGRLV